MATRGTGDNNGDDSGVPLFVALKLLQGNNKKEENSSSVITELHLVFGKIELAGWL